MRQQKGGYIQPTHMSASHLFECEIESVRAASRYVKPVFVLHLSSEFAVCAAALLAAPLRQGANPCYAKPSQTEVKSGRVFSRCRLDWDGGFVHAQKGRRVQELKAAGGQGWSFSHLREKVFRSFCTKCS